MALTYKTAGVDISKGNKLIDIIRPVVRSTFRRDVIKDIGPFSALFRLDTGKYRKPVLVSSTDGVGTKLKIAFMLDKHSTVGIDLVAMCVNDILTSGAEPLFFLDYFATGKLSTRRAADVIKGISEGCKIAGCSLIGGETAEMPGFYAQGEYDIAGFCVGIVDEKRIVTGSLIKEGDVVIGLSSNGIHSNGYSLARKVLFDIKKYKVKRFIHKLDRTVGDELLIPTRIYVKSVLGILEAFTIKGMAHITGGGITENLPRIFPKRYGVRAVINKGSWPVHEIFSIIQDAGRVTSKEMFRTFNMGIGFILIVNGRDASKIIKKLRSSGENAFIIGEIEKGRGGVKYI
jgi:phosphoribosylformylglycinamidine cyclo-ligase